MTASKPKAKAALRAGKPRPSAPESTSPPEAGAKAKPNAEVKSGNENTGSRRSNERNPTLGDWRAETLAEVRRLIHEADPDIVEKVKWFKPTNPSGVPVWSHAGIVCTGETYRQLVKLTFVRGASLADPCGLFNSSLDGATRRAIDIREGETLNAEAFKALILAAVAENHRSSAPARVSRDAESSERSAGTRTAKPVKLLSGGNPQIAKADGDAPVQDYIEAMPGWKRDVGRWLDALIMRQVPNVRKAVRWNSPFYGIEGQGWFLSTHCLTKYVRVTFFAGLSLQPVPPGGTPKSKEARWFDIYEDDEFDEAQMATWVKQAAALPGWIP